MKNKWFCFLFLVFFSSLLSSLTASEQISDAYKKMFDPKLKNDNLVQMFASDFIKAIPEKEIARIIQVYLSSLGPYVSVDQDKTPFVLHFDKGSAPSTIGFNSEGKINSLWFGAPSLETDSLEEVMSQFKKVEGKVSVCLMKNNVDLLIDLNAAEPMAVGSSFKLYILKALEQQVKAGKRSWTDLIKIDEKFKSFPSGILHDWPSGTSLTLESMAALMISISDNTATDHLFHLIGREELTKIFPRSYNPAFCTLDMFKLKIFYPESAQKFITADIAGKIEILDRLKDINVSQIASAAVITKWSKPIMIDSLEWFISARDLCDTIFHLKESSLIKINPARGLVDEKEWQTVGFKGGSEPGVLNYTWVLQPLNSDDYYCLSCTVNNSIDADKTTDFDLAVTRLIKLIRQKKIEVH